MPSDMAESIVFDMNLLHMGIWSQDERKLIEEWIKEDNFDDKRAAAANLLSVLIPKVLGTDCSTVGRIKAKRIGQTLHYFEDLLITTKAGIAKKFYRDHLNHMLRVMLLSNAISNQVDCFCDLKKEVKLVKIASLVHDIAYPIAESYHIIGETIKSMTKCYETLTFPEFKVNFREDKVNQLRDSLGPSVMPQSTLDSLKLESDHGFIGAIEFMDYVDSAKLKDYQRVFEAVAYHNSTKQIPKALEDDLLIKLLILSDELEDWGRPIGIEKESVMPAIQDFSLTPQGIQGKWEWKSYKDVSPLRQISSKLKNLSYVKWPSSFKLSVEFTLPVYRVINASQIERVTQNIINYCNAKRKDCISEFASAWESNKEFLRMFYGEDFPINKDLIEFSSNFVFNEDKTLHFDSEGRELFVTPAQFGDIHKIKISLEKGDIKLMLFKDNDYSSGVLFSQSDKTSKPFLQALICKIAIFQGLASRMQEKAVPTLLYPYPSKESTETALKLIGERDQEFGDNLRALRKSISDKGLFLFSEQSGADYGMVDKSAKP